MFHFANWISMPHYEGLGTHRICVGAKNRSIMERTLRGCKNKELYCKESFETTHVPVELTLRIGVSEMHDPKICHLSALFFLNQAQAHLSNILMIVACV